MERAIEGWFGNAESMQDSIDALYEQLRVKSVLVDALQEQLHSKEEQLRVKDATIKELHARIQTLFEQLRGMRSQRFGRSSEITPPEQTQMCFNEAEWVVAIEEQERSQEETLPSRKPKRPRAGTITLPADTPVQTILHDLDESQKHCPHDGHPLHVIGEEVSEQIDVQPAKVQVIRHVRPKYGCRCCEQGVHIAPLPPQPLPGTIASPNTAAVITVGKYIDHQPLYRQCQILERSGLEVSRATLARWVIDLAERERPLFNLLHESLLSSNWMQMDETPVQVLREPGRPASSSSYVWVQRTVVEGHAIVLFHYHPSRSGEVVRTLLAGYEGKYLQHDGYAAYESLPEGEILEGQRTRGEPLVHAGCFAHARRKFVEVLKALPKPHHKGSLAQPAIGYIDQLYRIESRIAQAPPEERYRVRQQESVPLLEDFERWWQPKLPAADPSTKIGKALAYLKRQWTRLLVYCEDGELSIDNNAIENAIRPFALGRKNWLFATTPKGAHASTIHYSILSTAKANGHDPYHYLRHVYKELPKATRLEDIEQLLPWNLDAQRIRDG